MIEMFLEDKIVWNASSAFSGTPTKLDSLYILFFRFVSACWEWEWEWSFYEKVIYDYG